VVVVVMVVPVVVLVTSFHEPGDIVQYGSSSMPLLFVAWMILSSPSQMAT
jgi:hypothetical protein